MRKGEHSEIESKEIKGTVTKLKIGKVKWEDGITSDMMKKGRIWSGVWYVIVICL